MIQFIRKHYILTALALILLGGYVYLYFTDFRYDDDMRDFRHYPIPPLTEKWTKTIEYKTLPHVKFSKCFILSFNGYQLSDNVNKMFGEGYISIISDQEDSQQYYREAYTSNYLLYHTEDLTDEEFYKEAKEKPHFWLKIYQDDVLLETRELYFTNFKSSSEIKIGNRELSAPVNTPQLKQLKNRHYCLFYTHLESSAPKIHADVHCYIALTNPPLDFEPPLNSEINIGLTLLPDKCG